MQEVELVQAPGVIQRGEVLIYPTETLYGMGVDIQNPEALELLYSLKGREKNKPVSLLVGSLNQLNQVVGERSATAQALWNFFLPGPLTLVLPAGKSLAPKLHGHSGWIGVRLSSHPWVRDFMARLENPITTTSANLSGQAGGQLAEQVWRDFGSVKGVYFLNGGDLPPSKGSTVLKVDGDHLQLLREGDIPFSEIQKVLRKND